MNAHVRSLALAGAIATVLAACGGGETAVTPTEPPAANAAPGASPSTLVSPSTGSSGEPSSTPDAGSQAADPDAVIAPDFTLALGEGGEFALSEEALPVYMVFWAEW